MIELPKQLTLAEWDARYQSLKAAGHREPPYGGPLSRHLEDGDYRLQRLTFDNAPASLRLWNFLLTEEERLRHARAAGKKLVGTMKDLGTVPIMAYAFDEIVAFYPDGAWWIPCVMELSAGLLDIADAMGVDQSFCPVRAMIGAFVTQAHFPLPDLLTCSVGAVCDDFSAIAQRLSGLGHSIHWWEIPHRRAPEQGEDPVVLPGGFAATASDVAFVKRELDRILSVLETLASRKLSDDALSHSIRTANDVRMAMARLRRDVFTADPCPLPGLEMLIVEMLAIHYCSDREETLQVIYDLIKEVDQRRRTGVGYFAKDAVRVFWVNPVADLRAMNLLEEMGGRICGTEYLFTHALDPIPTDIDPMTALAQMALADPMVGATQDRAHRIVRDIVQFGCEAVIVSKIPGASHCALEGGIIADVVSGQLEMPVLEIEVPPVSDPVRSSLKTRLEALVETVKRRRKTR